MPATRRVPPAARFAVLLLAAIAFAACSASASPGWTYEPPPSATSTPSASVAPSGEPSGQPTVTPSEPAGNTVKIVAQNIAFDVTSVEVPAGQPFTIEFDNQDAGVPHNVAITDHMGTEVFKGEIFNGVATKMYEVPALPAGDYTFHCTVHPNMTGTLTAS